MIVFPSQLQHLLAPLQVIASFPGAVILNVTQVFWELIWLAEDHNAEGQYRHLDIILHIIEGAVINNFLHILDDLFSFLPSEVPITIGLVQTVIH